MHTEKKLFLVVLVGALAFGLTSIGNAQTAARCEPSDKDCPKDGKQVVKTDDEKVEPPAADESAATSTADSERVTAEAKKSVPGRTTEDIRQTQTSAQDAQELAKKLSNPVASLISLPLQSNFDFGMGPNKDGFRYTLNVQPVIPIALNKDWNLISRTILPIIAQTNVVGTTSQFGLGDTAQSFFFSPNKTEPFIWGIGPQFLIPTATNEYLGTQKFGVGITGLILKQKGRWTVGSLVNHMWSVAGKDSRPDVSVTYIQPFLSYTTKTAWTFNLNTESTYDWEGKTWNVPIHFTVTKLVKFGKQPVSVGGALRCWANSGPGGPQWCGFRFIFTPLFPKK